VREDDRTILGYATPAPPTTARHVAGRVVGMMALTGAMILVSCGFALLWSRFFEGLGRGGG
jgi:hypothetical protein